MPHRRFHLEGDNMLSKTTLAVIVGAVFIIGVRNAPPTFAAPPSDSCALLTQAQVSAALGTSVESGEHVGGSPLMCGWSEPSDTNHNGKRVMANIFGPMGKLTPADRFNNVKTPIKGITKIPTSGIGDDAVYVTTGGLGTGLTVKKGSFVFEIRVYGFPLDQIEAKEKILAQDVLAKL
jgi:hypothetical protein